MCIDADWYSSVRCCLENFYDQVTDGGFVILDDYYTYDGCAVAVHQFLGECGLAHRMESVVGRSKDHEYYVSAVFRKATTTWYELRRLHLTSRDIVALIPQGDSFILVNEDQLGGMLTAGHRAIPFLERDGQYWGSPSDDETAIGELERLRRSGASFIVFA